MKERVKGLLKGKRKFLTIPAIPIAAFLAWPFVIPGLLGLLVHKKVSSSKWKYGLLAALAFFSIGSAPGYYANLTNPSIAQPNTVNTQTIDAAVQGAVAPTDTPTPNLLPSDTPPPTLVPATPTPIFVYIAPTTVFIPPTQAPAAQTTSPLDNNNSYTNVDGNQVHAPAN